MANISIDSIVTRWCDPNALANAKPTTIQDLLTQILQIAENTAVLNDRIACAVAQGNAGVKAENKQPTPTDIESRLYEISRVIRDANESAERTARTLGL